jgi:hypothetical protein
MPFRRRTTIRFEGQVASMAGDDDVATPEPHAGHPGCDRAGPAAYRPAPVARAVQARDRPQGRRGALQHREAGEAPDHRVSRPVVNAVLGVRLPGAVAASPTVGKPESATAGGSLDQWKATFAELVSLERTMGLRHRLDALGPAEASRARSFSRGWGVRSYSDPRRASRGRGCARDDSACSRQGEPSAGSALAAKLTGRAMSGSGPWRVRYGDP